MIANPAKFLAILLTKSRSNTAGKTMKIKNNLTQSESKVELLGLTIDNRLSFHSHISSICKKAAKQLNALKRLGSFFKFYSTKGTCTIIHRGKLQLLSNYMTFLFCKRPAQNGKGSRTYTSVLFMLIIRPLIANYYARPNLVTLELRRIQPICTEIYKTLNHMGPVCMNNLIIPNQ